jgi:flagellar protein FlaJ
LGVNALDRTAYRLFGQRALRAKNLPELELQLRKARLGVRAEAFQALAWLVALGTTVVATLLAIGIFFFLLATTGLNPVLGILLLLVPPLAFIGSYGAVMSYPSSRARSREHKIDERMAYAAHYMTALASAGVIPTEIFRSLSEQPVYGEITREAAWITKDTHIHGMDILTAMRRATERSPSEKWRDLLQGAITAIASGGDLTLYLSTKSRRLEQENRHVQQEFVDKMGLMAESYVTAAVALPLFLLVMVAIFNLMSVADDIFMIAIIYVMIPLMNILFIVFVKTQIPEI